jgi:CBS domain-containing protein
VPIASSGRKRQDPDAKFPSPKQSQDDKLLFQGDIRFFPSVPFAGRQMRPIPFQEAGMKVEDVMTRDVAIAAPQETIQQAARMMEDLDVGVLPVADNDRLVGMITDRDIAIRAVAAGKGPQAKVGDVMTRDVKYCYCDQELSEVGDNMADIQLRRLPVLNHDKRLVGILALGDIAISSDNDCASEALSGISRPRAGGLQPGL